jgi:hypothetical protein
MILPVALVHVLASIRLERVRLGVLFLLTLERTELLAASHGEHPFFALAAPSQSPHLPSLRNIENEL